MTISADITDVQVVARSFYRWLREPAADMLLDPGEATALTRLLGFSMTPGEQAQFSSRLRAQGSFEAYRHGLLDRWRGRADHQDLMSEADAHEFLTDFIGHVDHAIFFEQGITANVTYTRRGALNDTEMRFPGGMPCWTLHFTTRGRGLYLNDAMEAAPERGQIMLFHPDAHYHYGLHPGADEWEHLWVLFQPRPNWEPWLDWPALDTGISLVTVRDDESIEKLESLFRELIALRQEAAPFRNDLEHNRLEELLIRSRQYASGASHRERDPRVQRACDYMQDKLATRFNVEDVAAACNLSPSRLAHLFKEHMGISPKSWSNTMRLQQARKLLLASDDPIALVAARVGYDDPAQFSKYFSKNVGCSPREFRRSFRDNS